jgi:protein-disulfide isomerase
VIALFWYFKSQPNENIIINMTEVMGTGRPTLGNPNAPVTIVEFSDFQCPYCAIFSKETYPLIKRDYISTGKAKMIFRNFPIYQAHPQAMQAAEASLCVHKEGRDESFFKYHDKLFQNYQDLPEDKLIIWASEIGYNITSCLQSKALRNDVLKDIEDAGKAGVKGTPSFFINGKFISGNQPYSEFKKVIESS